MKPHDNNEICEGELAAFWLDEDGILCQIKKHNATLQEQKDNSDFRGKYHVIKKYTFYRILSPYLCWTN